MKQQKIEPPKFGRANTERNIIPVIMRWLHDRGCAVVVWTEEELKGVDVDSLEGSLIEWGSESIQMNAEEATK